MEPRRIILIMVLFLAALVTSGCVSPDQSNITITPKGEPAFQFNAPDTLTATAGEYFEYSFCDPKPATDTSPCGPMPATSNPTGGNPAYHFVLGSGTGFPPFGLSLGKDGILKGTVDKSEAGRTKTIDVCAVDLSGDSVCLPVTVVVSAPAAPPCAGTAYQNTTWRGTIDAKAAAEPYHTTFEFTFGAPTFYSGFCDIPIVSGKVNDASRTWSLWSKSTISSPNHLFCDQTSCTEFALDFILTAGPSPYSGDTEVDKVIQMTAGRTKISATSIQGYAGLGSATKGCCGSGSFTATPR